MYRETVTQIVNVETNGLGTIVKLPHETYEEDHYVYYNDVYFKPANGSRIETIVTIQSYVLDDDMFGHHEGVDDPYIDKYLGDLYRDEEHVGMIFLGYEWKREYSSSEGDTTYICTYTDDITITGEANAFELTVFGSKDCNNLHYAQLVSWGYNDKSYDERTYVWGDTSSEHTYTNVVIFNGKYDQSEDTLPEKFSWWIPHSDSTSFNWWSTANPAAGPYASIEFIDYFY